MQEILRSLKSDEDVLYLFTILHIILEVIASFLKHKTYPTHVSIHDITHNFRGNRIVFKNTGLNSFLNHFL